MFKNYTINLTKMKPSKLRKEIEKEIIDLVVEIQNGEPYLSTGAKELIEETTDKLLSLFLRTMKGIIGNNEKITIPEKLGQLSIEMGKHIRNHLRFLQRNKLHELKVT